MTDAPAVDVPQERQPVRPMALLGGPRSPEATALTDHILTDVVLPARIAAKAEEQQKPERPSSVKRLQTAIGALLADLFDLEADGSEGKPVPAGIHGASKTDFNLDRLGFAYDIFMEVRGALEGAGLLTTTTGNPNWHPTFDRFVVVGGDATTFRLSQDAIGLAANYGIDVTAWDVHWRRTGDRPLQVSPKVPRLVLRKKRERIAGKKQDAKDHPFKASDPEPLSILAGIDRLNGFLGQQDIDGIAFPGLRRIFNNGDQPDFAWNKGGRYFSLKGGHQYEGWSADKRRRAIKLNGEAVDEVDLRASHLSLLHALMRHPLDTESDPYGIDEWPRAVVKAWVSQAIGASNPRPVQWSGDAQAAYEAWYPGRFLQDEFPIREVGAAVTELHPLLIELKFCGLGTLELQYHEAEILRLAIEDLMLTQGIAVLPMHDAIIAPRSKLGETREALLRAFAVHVEDVTGHPSLVVPKVTLKD